MCKMWICVLFFVCVVISPAVTRVSSSGLLSPCSADDVEQFRCDGECLDLARVCDGVKDCLDGSDEAICDSNFDSSYNANIGDLLLNRSKRQSACRRTQWQCRDGSCISFDGKCDGAVDCPDRSDETHALCRNIPCQSNWFRCTYGACVDGTAPCNGVTECADNSDELLPRCRNETLEVRGKFKCRDGSTISASDHCDGIANCPDGSDETVAACGDKTCPSYLFQCAYGACVDQGSDCNGVQECADGSDETDELCDRIGTSVKPTPKPGACVLPPYPDHGTYTVANLPDAKPGQSFNDFVITVSCQRGYGLLEPDGGRDGNGTQSIYCISGTLYGTIPKCVQFCRLEQDPSVTYMCQIPGTNGFLACKHYVEPGVAVKPVCNSPNYYSSEVLKYMKCIDGSWDYVALCKPGLINTGINVTIHIKDKIVVYISDFTHTSDINNNDKVTVNIASNSNSANVYSFNNNGFSINIKNNNNPNRNNIDSTLNPLVSEISGDEWRMGPESNKSETNGNLKTYNNSDAVKYRDIIVFRE